MLQQGQNYSFLSVSDKVNYNKEMPGEKAVEDAGDGVEGGGSLAVYDKEEFECLPGEEVSKLCGDYAAYARVSLAEEHGQVDGEGRGVAGFNTYLCHLKIVTNIAAIEEQLQAFTEMVEMIGSDK